MDFDALDVSQAPSISTIVYETLKKAIIAGKITPGTPLSQERIASSFKTSRIPVREALARLESQGLVTQRRYKGAVVTELRLDEISEIFDLRATIESDMIRRSMRSASPDKIQISQHYLEAFQAHDTPEHWIALNRKFHCSLYNHVSSPIYMKTIEQLLDRLDCYLRAQLSLTHGLTRAQREHEAIMQAFVKGDEEKAARLTYEHIIGAKHSLIDHIKHEKGE